MTLRKSLTKKKKTGKEPRVATHILWTGKAVVCNEGGCQLQTGKLLAGSLKRAGEGKKSSDEWAGARETAARSKW